jgi:hypothetical protein
MATIYKVTVTVEANDPEDACYRVLGWQPKFARTATVIENGVARKYEPGRRGYEGWEPCWRELKGGEGDR